MDRLAIDLGGGESHIHARRPNNDVHLERRASTRARTPPPCRAAVSDPTKGLKRHRIAPRDAAPPTVDEVFAMVDVAKRSGPRPTRTRNADIIEVSWRSSSRPSTHGRRFSLRAVHDVIAGASRRAGIARPIDATPVDGGAEHRKRSAPAPSAHADVALRLSDARVPAHVPRPGVGHRHTELRHFSRGRVPHELSVDLQRKPDASTGDLPSTMPAIDV